MPAAKTTVGLINGLGGPEAAKDTALVMATLAGSTGMAMFIKKMGWWSKYNKVEQRELELLDADMPSGAWRHIQTHAPRYLFMGKKIKWFHKTGWQVGESPGGNYAIGTPVLDEETGQLV